LLHFFEIIQDLLFARAGFDALNTPCNLLDHLGVCGIGLGQLKVQTPRRVSKLFVLSGMPSHMQLEANGAQEGHLSMHAELAY
jgi:hypothetical protein